MSPERAEWHVANWVRWMHEDDHGLGYPRHSPVLATSRSRDFDGLLAESDVVCAMAVDAIVQGMAPQYRLTVYMRHDLCASTFRLSGDPEANYAEALRIITVGLNRKGVP